MKKLYRSEDNKIFAGIIGGIGEYLEIDPTALRLLWLVFLVLTAFFPGIIIYLVAMAIVPKRGEGQDRKKEESK